MRYLLVILLSGFALAGCSIAPEQSSTGQRDQPNLNEAPLSEAMQPVAIRIPSISLNSQRSDWVPLGIQGERGVPVTPPAEPGQIEVPPIKQPLKLGFYCPNGLPACGAPVPGQMGPAVVLGHVNGGGKQGIFAKLAAKDAKGKYLIQPGAIIEIDRADNVTVTFKVVKIETPLKKDFPTQAVYGDTNTPTLRLITCGGGGNALETTSTGSRSYVNQTIVYADMVSQRPI
jgi:hypothetical protein